MLLTGTQHAQRTALALALSSLTHSLTVRLEAWRDAYCVLCVVSSCVLWLWLHAAARYKTTSPGVSGTYKLQSSDSRAHNAARALRLRRPWPLLGALAARGRGARPWTARQASR